MSTQTVSSLLRLPTRRFSKHCKCAPYSNTFRRSSTFRPAFAFDIDGVLLRESVPLPGARDALLELQRRSIPFILLTNGGGKTEKARVEQLSQLLDIDLDLSLFVQSHTPFAELVHGKNRNIHMNEDYTQTALKDKNVLVVGGDGETCRLVAQEYGFKNVIIPADLIVAFPNLWPFAPTTNYERLARPLPSSKLLSQSIEAVPASRHSESDLASALKIDAVLVFSDPRDWALDTQIILDLLLSHKGYMGTISMKNGDTKLKNAGYQQDGQPALYFSNPDFHWAAAWHLPRLGQGAFREALEGVWRALTDRDKGDEDIVIQLQKRMIGKPYAATYEFAETQLARYCDRTAKTLPTDVFMVGDNPESDILGANSFKSSRGIHWHSILVRSGVFSGSRPRIEPSTGQIMRGVAEAVEWALERH